jgi:hypothetical protein
MLSLPELVKQSSAVESLNVAVYWDPLCTNTVTTINWGNLTPGSTTKINIFAKNEELEKPCFLYMNTQDWNPTEASHYIKLYWDYNSISIDVQTVLPITLTLNIKQDVTQITEFKFNIIIIATDHLIGDLDRDGIVDIRDVAEVALAYGATPLDPNWNPRADLNEDNTIDIKDIVIVSKNYGVTSK